MILKNYNFKTPKIEDLKPITNVLFIDDEDRSKLIDYLKNEGWYCSQIYDVEYLEHLDIKKATIIFVDILGVGQKLEKENQGLDIVVSLKEKYPEKKVAVYSSKETHNMFHPANEIVDKRISKRGGDFEVFRKAIEELSAKCYNWDYVIDEIYKRIRHELPEEIDRERLKKELEKSVTNRKKINRKRIMKILKVSKDNYNFIILAIQLVLSI